MATVNYSLRVDETDKQRAEQVFKALGMTFSTGINIYLKTVGRQQRIPFNLTLLEPVSGNTRTTRTDKEQAFHALNGILAGHDVNLDEERSKRINS